MLDTVQHGDVLIALYITLLDCCFMPIDIHQQLTVPLKRYALLPEIRDRTVLPNAAAVLLGRVSRTLVESFNVELLCHAMVCEYTY